MSHIDKYARRKINTFCRRHGSEAVFETRSNGQPHNQIFLTRVRLPLPPQYGVQYGKGKAKNKKESIIRAAMDAIDVLDRIGFPLYDLPAAQRKHLENRRTYASANTGHYGGRNFGNGRNASHSFGSSGGNFSNRSAQSSSYGNFSNRSSQSSSYGNLPKKSSGSASSSDPFAASASSDPFASCSDPFASSSDPFSKSSDPFAASSSSSSSSSSGSDPFAASDPFASSVQSFSSSKSFSSPPKKSSFNSSSRSSSNMFSSPTPFVSSRSVEDMPLPQKDVNSVVFQKAAIQKATLYAQHSKDRFAHVRHRSFCGRQQSRGNPQPAPHVTVRNNKHVTSLWVPVPGSQLRWVAVGRAGKKVDSHKMACRVFFSILDILSLSEPRKDGTFGRLDPRSKGGQGSFSQYSISNSKFPQRSMAASSRPFPGSNSPAPTSNYSSSTSNSQSQIPRPSSSQSSQSNVNAPNQDDSIPVDMARNVVLMYVACLCLPTIAERVKQTGPRHAPAFTFYLSTFLPDRKTRIISKGVARGKKEMAENLAYVDMYQRLQKDPRSNILVLRKIFTSARVIPESILQLHVPNDLRPEISQLVKDFEYHQSCGIYSGTDVMLRVRRNNALSIFGENARIHAERPALSARLQTQRNNKKRRPNRHQQHRESLPIFAYRKKILETIANNQVVVISGETGSGKTTQIPQYIFEELIEQGNGGKCNIITTQPRRISAISVARRVAEERGERLGDTIGYQIRLENVRGSNILFCTAGVLLRLLNNCSTLSVVSHIIMDEVHERAINSDFLLIILKKILNHRKDIKLIVMSATLHTKDFSEFFWDAPVIELEGRCFPVKEYYLTDIKQIACDSGWPSESASVYNPREMNMQDEVKKINYPLLACLIAHAAMDLLQKGEGASILVFLPGWKEIVDTKNALTRMPINNSTPPHFRQFFEKIHNENDSSFKVLPLHSSLTSEEQQQIFKPSACINIILSTNIAETGITIGNIKTVIDCGQVKEKSSYSVSVESGRMTQLLTRKIAKANAIQRQGRAGRTQHGMCYKLFTREEYEAMQEFQTPEIKRIPLDQVVLQIISLKLGQPEEFLGKALEPPKIERIQQSIARLKSLKAITLVNVDDEAFADPESLSGEKKLALTPLGFRMALLPVEPHSARMILLASIFKCLDPILTIAAGSETDPWIKSHSVRDEVDSSKTKFCNNNLSDHIAVVNVYNDWASKPPMEAYRFCKENYLSINQLGTLSKIKSQFYNILKRSRFLDDQSWVSYNPQYRKSYQQRNTQETVAIQNTEVQEEIPKVEDQKEGDSNEDIKMEKDIVPVELPPPVPRFVDDSPASFNARSITVIKGLITAGLFPNVCLHREKRLFSTITEDQMLAHPCSVLKKESGFTSPWFVYNEKGKSAAANKVYARDLTNSHPFSLLLMTGANISYAREFNLLLIYGWIPFLVDAESAELILGLQKTIEKSIQKKFQSPTNRQNNEIIERFIPLVMKLLDVGFRGHPGRQGRGKHRVEGNFGFVPMQSAPSLQKHTESEEQMSLSIEKTANVQYASGEPDQEPEQEPVQESGQDMDQEPEQEPGQDDMGEIHSELYGSNDEDFMDENNSNVNPYLADIGKRKGEAETISPGIKKLKSEEDRKKLSDIEQQILELQRLKARYQGE